MVVRLQSPSIYMGWLCPRRSLSDGLRQNLQRIEALREELATREAELKALESGQQLAELEADIREDLLGVHKLAERSWPKDEAITELDLDRETAVTQARYDRIAPFYDVMLWGTEGSAFQAWREDLWSRIPPGRTLEVGVGTG